MLDLGALNPPQREAVEHGEGPLLVLAGAGSGKTRVITYRVARLCERGIPPRAILALSFTNKAAGEMRERARRLCGPAAKVWMGTFHALGLQLLREERRGQPFTVYDAADQIGLVRDVLRQLRWEDRRWDAKAILARISRWKNARRSPEEVEAQPELLRDEYDEAAAQVWPRYQAALANFAAFDFDDLLVEPLRLSRPAWQERWQTLLVDEYQDTNRVQLALVQHLGARHRNVCVVGDDDQSIYGWRGAEARNILDFERHFRGARVVKLEENYRSRPPILAAANAVIGKSSCRYEKTLWTRRPPGDPVRLCVLEDPEAEARFVATEIQALGAAPADVAVLYRSNIQARPLEDALREAGLPYEVVGGQEFYDRKEVKDVLGYLRLALWPRDEIALRRVVNFPPRGIGPATLARAAAAGPTLAQGLRPLAPAFFDLVDRLRAGIERGEAAGATRALVEEIGLYEELRQAAPSASAAERRIGHIRDLLAGLEGRADLRAYLSALALRAADHDARERDGNTVTLTTLHGAKGLEFPIVFLVGLEEELLPHARTIDPIATDVLGDAADPDEERRLCYVGITRARDRLYLTRTLHRIKRGRAFAVTPSRFLDDIPAELLSTETRADETKVADDCLAKLRALVGTAD